MVACCVLLFRAASCTRAPLHRNASTSPIHAYLCLAEHKLHIAPRNVALPFPSCFSRDLVPVLFSLCYYYYFSFLGILLLVFLIISSYSFVIFLHELFPIFLALICTYSRHFIIFSPLSFPLSWFLSLFLFFFFVSSFAVSFLSIIFLRVFIR